MAEVKNKDKDVEKCPGYKNEEIKVPKDILEKLKKAEKEKNQSAGR